MTRPPEHPNSSLAALQQIIGDRLIHEVEHATMGLIAVAPPEHLPAVRDEVWRRAALMGTLHATRSVYDDIINGRWPR